MQVIEFQTRDLPHVHILLRFIKDDKLETAEDIDNLISAEISDPTVDPELHENVKTSMQNYTIIKGIQVDNRSLVPYNSWLKN